MILFWRRLSWLVMRDFDAPTDNIEDEESLRCGPGPLQRPRRKCRFVPKLRRATVLLLLSDLVIMGLLLQALEPLIILLLKNEELFGARVALHTSEVPGNPSTEPPGIPRILHQTSATETIPDKWIESQRSCMEACSDFKYKVR